MLPEGVLNPNNCRVSDGLKEASGGNGEACTSGHLQTGIIFEKGPKASDSSGLPRCPSLCTLAVRLLRMGEIEGLAHT